MRFCFVLAAGNGQNRRYTCDPTIPCILSKCRASPLIHPFRHHVRWFSASIILTVLRISYDSTEDLPLLLASSVLAPHSLDWNYRTLQLLFEAVPHRVQTVNFFQFLVLNPLVSGWIFAAVFYVSWSINDERQVWRRSCLLRIVIGFGIAIVLSLMIRPWIAWPSPARSPEFQPLFPDYLWGIGSRDSFPSHATLAYFVVAAGIWTINRTASVLLSLGVLLLICLPRLYLGGHYPVDVVSSIILVLIILSAISRWKLPNRVSDYMVRGGRQGLLREILLFLWIFELAEGFDSGKYILVHTARHLLHWF